MVTERTGGMSMVRIKVYKASQLAVAAAAILMAAALIAVLISIALRGGAETVGGTTIIWEEAAVEVAAAFSMVDFPDGPIIPDPEDFIPENEHTDEPADEIIIEIIRAEAAPEENVGMAERQARVLIYHTHTHEAYAQDAEDPYVETEAWRTADQGHSVVRVGEALSELLRGYGMEVVHDVTDHEPPKLSTAYARSLKTLEGYADEEFDLYIDLHRDAYNASMKEYAESNGQRMAQLMVLIGNGGEYEVKPDYEANLRFALELTNCINEKNPGLCREVMVKNGRYNQHIGTPAILIEVGHNENTLQQALSSMPALADALKEVLTSS